MNLEYLVENFIDAYNRFESDRIKNSPLKELTLVQIHYIDIIYHNPGINSIEIAKLFHISKPSVSVHIDKLVNKGLVIKESSINDKRSTHLILSPRGKELALLHDNIHSDFTNEIKQQLNADETKTLTTLLNKILTNRSNTNEQK